MFVTRTELKLKKIDPPVYDIIVPNFIHGKNDPFAFLGDIIFNESLSIISKNEINLGNISKGVYSLKVY